MKVLITGSRGFIGKNLAIRLSEINVQIEEYNRHDPISSLPELVEKVDFVVHLAGENRPKDHSCFDIVNVGLTESLCSAIRYSDKKPAIIFVSSIQATYDNDYGRSKLAAEEVVKSLSHVTGIRTYIYRLPGVFGKWCKPNYNSVVATFCYNISHNIPIEISDESKWLSLVYIDDVIEDFIELIKEHEEREGLAYQFIKTSYRITLGELAAQLLKFRESRYSLLSERVGHGLIRKLYSTYISYLSPEDFSYPIPCYGDDRGVFSEFLKTQDSGQLSYFTINAEVSRGGHYHHSKTEKFLVVQGKVEFEFEDIVSRERRSLIVSSDELRVVETVPGWAHSVTNVGSSEAVVLLWSNEVFDKNKPDTVAYKA